jgi:hypothetical protein
MADSAETAIYGSDVDADFDENIDNFVGKLYVLSSADRELHFDEMNGDDENWLVENLISKLNFNVCNSKWRTVLKRS